MAHSADHPRTTRVYHWINLVSMAVLILTGFYIHRPFAPGYMFEARLLHFIFMYVLFFNLLGRIIYAFLGRYADAGQFSFGIKDIKALWEVVKYYAFIGPHPQKSGKYNALQKLSYLGIVVIILFQAVTGFALYRPELFSSVVTTLGGLHALRMTHYLVMWIIIAFTIIHVYMASTETPEQVKLMLFGIEEGKEHAGQEKVAGISSGHR
ncbi:MULTISPECIES: Ni/Fe-hydrogenase, b-type cytochrome subunit [Carboxydocella]|uniref:Ni/Fe-hydrogenase 1 B-type cytochrome subunit n=2 Tax=Carboxydocella TaxID=178898 RepID=A0A1T4S2M3_9FIRM|nr:MULTISPECIES: Ni/Fe-hydrogenase, b-type cytochrome subunit [Carboxydocella]AVX20667.1 Ni/Fe-hydrogenase 1 B-type cytochrome subunit [Carboxydocella thermautotrophica]GAW28201.1 Ni/Fe-hydrogenase, b-type cytochrome subunit [Carboxydocella sp. ULO1]GAW32808.1 Ni/Fe-hydrogenase, b-type cytochrome subunit [Carboxydocella sp. JDF658]SKA22474.1 Ni/Fe-hydrogenase 1 B-type cytochrome subunit [Carboxydocella sporoproducens DSM 16521]